MINNNPLLEKSLKFAARIVNLNKYLIKEKHETVISKQIVRRVQIMLCFYIPFHSHCRRQQEYQRLQDTHCAHPLP